MLIMLWVTHLQPQYLRILFVNQTPHDDPLQDIPARYHSDYLSGFTFDDNDGKTRVFAFIE